MGFSAGLVGLALAVTCGIHLVSADEVSDPGSCTPGSNFKLDCNTCVCSASGRRNESICTLMACLSPGIFNLVTTTSADSCTPHSTFQVDCNSCTCGESGKKSEANCTTEVCESSHHVTTRDVAANPEVCTPGSTYLEDCNTCICGRTGNKSESACTLKVCNHTGDETSKKDECTPGTTYNDDCNMCICGISGKKSESACTLKVCPPHRVESRELFPDVATDGDSCTPGSSFQVDCNNCTCGREGKKSKSPCSTLVCPTNNSVTIVEEEEDDECMPGTTFKEGCNTCTCGNDGRKSTARCSLMACINYINSRDPPTTCTPFTNFLDECNTCMCGSDGLRVNAACTSMSCPLKPLSRSKRDGERCDPGSHFHDDCNACICGQDGIRDHASCTFHVCPLMLPCPTNEVYCVPVFAVPVDGERCSPGVTFFDECNTCICAQDGIKAHASCTFKDCNKRS